MQGKRHTHLEPPKGSVPTLSTRREACTTGWAFLCARLSGSTTMHTRILRRVWCGDTTQPQVGGADRPIHGEALPNPKPSLSATGHWQERRRSLRPSPCEAVQSVRSTDPRAPASMPDVLTQYRVAEARTRLSASK